MSQETSSASDSTAKRRILVVQAPEQWTGAINEQSFLEIPAQMDVAQEEQNWFASGGDSSGKSFAEYLIGQGAALLPVEVWNINYM